jgi:hypothetical protein
MGQERYDGVMSSALKQEVHALVDRLPDDELKAARRYLEYLRDASDPYAHLDEVDDLDEAEREKLHQSLERGIAEARAGQGRPAREFLAELRARR